MLQDIYKYTLKQWPDLLRTWKSNLLSINSYPTRDSLGAL